MSDWLKRNNFRLAFNFLLISNILVWGLLFSLPDGNLHLKFYDVGQGDSIFLKTAAGFNILIDGGPDNKVLAYLGKDLPFYSKKIDLLILTHPQADHLTGLLEVTKRYQIRNLWVSNSTNNTRIYHDWVDTLQKSNIKPAVVYQGDKMVFPDKTEILILWPKKEVQYPDINAYSIVVQVSYGNFDAMLTGDADRQVQPYTSDHSHVEVFKVPHHGSKTAISETYLSSLSPQVSIISVGSKNRYGHPSKDLINFLKKIGSKVYRTDLNGTVEIESNGKSWYTKTQITK